MEIKTLFEYGRVGFFSYCEVTQIILFDSEKKEYWNYFTHISFSKNITDSSKQEWLTDKPKKINKFIKVMIIKQNVSLADIMPVLECAVEKQEWVMGENCAKLDEVFMLEPQYVPETDPTGNTISENTLVPLELSLYGSNFKGNYYVVELFSTKRNLNSVLTDNDKKNIQKEINAVHLGYNLYNLSDRIGNIICKLPIEIIKHELTKLTPERGVAGKFEREKSVDRCINCYLNILSMNDHMLLENRILPFTLSDEHSEYEYEIKPNRYKNMVTVVDQDTGIIYYSSEHDYSFGSNYYSTITPPNYCLQTPLSRSFNVQGAVQKCELAAVSGMGEISIQKEIYEIEQRQNKWKDQRIRESHFFNVFENGDREKAIAIIKSIINDRSLLWDLKEIWLVDPYLSAADILATVVYCNKKGITIKCLTDIGTIDRNKETRMKAETGQDRFTTTKEAFAKCLKDAIPSDSDLKIEFRTVRGVHGKPFHDRYLILKYAINKCRVWSLGISVNAIGTSHHIIQIVESPSAVADIIEKIWLATDNEECLIYSNLYY